MSSDNNKPLVSIIVLTYNHEKYIKKALDSILMQKVNFDYEILVGDDASTDGTVSILKEYHKRYPEKIKLYLNKVNVGATRNAYNILMSSNGDYLATCEGDDYWTDEFKLQMQIDFLENHRDFIGCTHKFTIVDENEKIYKSQHLSWVKQKTRFTINDFKGIYLPGQPSTFVRRNIIYKINLKYMYKISNMIGDRFLLLSYLMYGDFALICKNMSCYRIRGNSITRDIYIDKFNALEKDYECTVELEKFASEMNFELDFSEFKSLLILKLIYFMIIEKNTLYINLLKEIFKKEKNKIILNIPKVFFRELVRRVML